MLGKFIKKVLITTMVICFSSISFSTYAYASPKVVTSSINNEQGGKNFTFAHITDIHMGRDIDDYGTEGYDDEAPEGDVGVAAQNLRDTVNWINENYESKGIEFVIITGDISDSAEKSEFVKAKEILDTLEIPYVPLTGNHDIWPYTSNDEAPEAVGEQYFMEVFEDTFDSLSTHFEEWDDGTRLTKTWNPEQNCYNYFQNFAFNYKGYHFMCADFNARFHSKTVGVPSEASLYDFSGGTWSWFKDHYNEYKSDEEDKMLIFAHHGLTNDFKSTFSPNEYKKVSSFLYDNGNINRTGLWCYGHMHMNIEANAYKLGSLGAICPRIQTAACKDGDGKLRVITVWGAE
ncbi:metallophosphoesterase family protein [Clostridium ganghwense]|uniref:Metallophosphoesterase n=1 Tax=Clostridium ganghwense TaxID=312089 RepID=A0ABT4CJY0_9CLOT|nr:metallophosphoesterase [Clostridium ganghwense]MCY6369351.1 metallophosphoesterase [Clostridium ganghwense]